LLIPAGTYSGSVPGSSNTLSVCTSKRCYCTWQWIGITRTTAPTIRLNLTDATTSLAVNPFVIPDVLDTSGNPSAVASRTIILDSASGTTPSWDVYLSTTTASAIGVLTACSMVQ
jgi:hypothetical protein